MAIGAPVRATDLDDDQLVYRLGGADAAAFELDAPSGQLQTLPAHVYDYEQQARYEVTVVATDTHGAAATVEVTILIIDLDEPGEPCPDADQAPRPCTRCRPS